MCKLKNKNKDKKEANFFGLSAKEQKQIIKKAIKEANEEQLDLVKKYDQEYGSDFIFNECKL